MKETRPKFNIGDRFKIRGGGYMEIIEVSSNGRHYEFRMDKKYFSEDNQIRGMSCILFDALVGRKHFYLQSKVSKRIK